MHRTACLEEAASVAGVVITTITDENFARHLAPSSSKSKSALEKQLTAWS
jgi:hypothetical protein